MDIKKFKSILEENIKTSDQVFIAPHLGSDFDSIGSAIGFSLIANRFLKPNYIFLCENPCKIEPGVQLIIEEYCNKATFIDLEKYQNIKGANDLLIATDTNKKRLVGCKEYLQNFKKIMILDHHNTDEDTIEAETIFIPEKISSVCEIMVDLLCKFGINYDQDIANYLLLGIYLDTNKLSKLNKDSIAASKTLKIVSKLIKKGASLEKVQNYFTEDLKNAKKIQDLAQKVMYITYTYAIAIENTAIYAKEDLAKVADRLLTHKIVDASFAVGEIDDEIVSISARSKGKIDVSKIMQNLSGGGNIYSAATKIEGESVEEVGQKLIKELKSPFNVDEFN